MRACARVCIKLILVEPPINNIVTDLVVGNAYFRKYKVSIFEVPCCYMELVFLDDNRVNIFINQTCNFHWGHC